MNENDTMDTFNRTLRLKTTTLFVAPAAAAAATAFEYYSVFELLMNWEFKLERMQKSVQKLAKYFTDKYGIKFPYNYILVVVLAILSAVSVHTLMKKYCQRRKSQTQAVLDDAQVEKLLEKIISKMGETKKGESKEVDNNAKIDSIEKDVKEIK